MIDNIIDLAKRYDFFFAILEFRDFRLHVGLIGLRKLHLCFIVALLRLYYVYLFLRESNPKSLEFRRYKFCSCLVSAAWICKDK